MKSFVQSYLLIFDNIILWNLTLSFSTLLTPLTRLPHHPAPQLRTQSEIINPQSIAIERIAGEEKC